MCGCLLRDPHYGPGLQPRHVPWLGIEPVTLWFSGWCSIHWATPDRTRVLFFMAEYYFIVRICCFIHPLIPWWTFGLSSPLGCCKWCCVEHSRTMCGHAVLLLWGIYLRVELLGRMVTLCLTLWGTLRLTSTGLESLPCGRLGAGCFTCVESLHPPNSSVRCVTTIILIS